MDVEIVDHKVPLCGRWIRRHGALDMGGKVLFRSCRTARRLQHLASGHLKVDDETLRPMPLILEFLVLDLARRQRQGWVLALQGLDPAQLIGRDEALPLLGQGWRLAVQGVDVLHFFVKSFIGHWIQPVAHPMRFEIALFLKASPRDEGRWNLQCRVSLLRRRSRGWSIG